MKNNKNMNKTIVVPYSGGMDSTVLLYSAVKQVGPENTHAVVFKYGQKHIKEIGSANYHIKKLGCHSNTIDITKMKTNLFATSALVSNEIDVPDVQCIRGHAQPPTYVPMRNDLFVTMCAAYAEAQELHHTSIWLGATAVDSLAGYWDASAEFIDARNKLLSLNRLFNFKLEAPLLHLNKKDIIQRGLDLGVDFSKTWTCYSGEDKPNAHTASSSLRIQGFIDLQLQDPLEYQQQELLNRRYMELGCKKIRG